MKRILYLMHVPWRWVKQRPHYLAEQLAAFYEVEVCFRKMYFVGKQLANDLPSAVPVHELFVIPPERFDVIWKLNCRLFGFQLRNVIGSYDLVWITHPLMLDLVESVLPAGIKVVYDCMDDALEFPRITKNSRLRQHVSSSEGKLATRSDVVFASTQTLKERISTRYGMPKHIEVLPNAIFLEKEEPGEVVRPDIAAAFHTAHCTLTYIGTVSEWFDFRLVLDTLDTCTEVTVLLFGPTEVPIPRHERLHHFGPVEHRQIYAIMALSNALIMPFKVNHLILGVDPVKLYEYIFACRPVVAVDYPEMGKFSEYVYLYGSDAEFRKLVTNVAANRLSLKTSADNHRSFASANTWGARTQWIQSVIDRLF